MSMDGMIANEVKELSKDRKTSSEELDRQRSKYAEEVLSGGIGDDIMAVLDGKVKVEAKTSVKLRYRILSFINKIFRTI